MKISYYVHFRCSMRSMRSMRSVRSVRSMRSMLSMHRAKLFNIFCFPSGYITYIGNVIIVKTCPIRTTYLIDFTYKHKTQVYMTKQ